MVKNKRAILVMHIDFIKDTSKVMSLIENPDSVTSARIWICKFKSIKPVSECKNLRTLVLNTVLDDDISWLVKLEKLEYLKIQNFPKIKSIEFLSSMETIKTLSLSTSPSWDSSGRTMEVDALTPLQKLTSLQHIELLGVHQKDFSVAALEKCGSLISARFSGYPQEIISRFYEKTGVKKEFAPEPVFD